MKVLYSLFSNQVTGVDREMFPAEGVIDCPFPLVLQKTVQELTGKQVQKVNDQDQPLYKTNASVDDLGVETYTETTESLEVTKWETKTVTNKIATDETTTETQDVLQEDGSVLPTEVQVPVYQTISSEVQFPVEWLNYDPVMVDEAVNRNYSFDQNPYLFTKDEVEGAIATTKPVKSEQQITTERVDAVEGAVMALMDMSLMT